MINEDRSKIVRCNAAHGSYDVKLGYFYRFGNTIVDYFAIELPHNGIGITRNAMKNLAEEILSFIESHTIKNFEEENLIKDMQEAKNKLEYLNGFLKGLSERINK